MSPLPRTLCFAGVIAAIVAFAKAPERAPVEAFSNRAFADRLKSAADRATSGLREAPEVAWADIRVRSIDEHEPLRVEASVSWTSNPVPAERKQALMSRIRSQFDSFACVEVVLGEATR
jgi:hypothetical protein